MTMLSSVTLPATSQHRYSIIWLHGLGADGHDFEAIVPELALNKAENIQFIFPNAPIQPVTINGNATMRSWYDILEPNLDKKVATEDIYLSAAELDKFIQQELDSGIKSEHILLAGFSQGGVIALHCGLRYPQKLAGIIALSTYLPTTEQLTTERSTANHQTTIFMAHGTMDTVVQPSIAQSAYQTLKQLEYPIQWHQYPMPHSVCTEEINNISEFINNIFN